MSILEKLKQTSTKEEKVKLLNEFLGSDKRLGTPEELETRLYIKSQKDLVDILSEMKKESKALLGKGGLKSVLAQIDEYNKVNRPELVPTDPSSIKERTELMNKYKDQNKSSK
jgi:hypothetical protein